MGLKIFKKFVNFTKKITYLSSFCLVRCYSYSNCLNLLLVYLKLVFSYYRLFGQRTF